MKSLFFYLSLFALLCAYSVDFEDLPSFMNDEAASEEFSRPEFQDFMSRFGNDYGYNGTIDTMFTWITRVRDCTVSLKSGNAVTSS